MTMQSYADSGMAASLCHPLAPRRSAQRATPPDGGAGAKVACYAVVLVWPDGSSRVLQPGDQIPAPAASAALSDAGSGIDLPAA